MHHDLRAILSACTPCFEPTDCLCASRTRPSREGGK